MSRAALRRSRSYQTDQTRLDTINENAPLPIHSPPQSAIHRLLEHVTLGPVMVAAALGGYLCARQHNYLPILTVVLAEIIAVTLYLIVWLSWIYPYYVSELRHVPTVKGFPLWGQFPAILTEECGTPHRRWHQEHGALVRYFFLFGSERISVADDEGLKHVTVKNPYNFPKPHRIKVWMVRILGEGVLLAEGQEHVHQRKALAPGFSHSSIRALTPVFWEKALLMSKCWRDEMREDDSKTKTFEILEWMNRCTLDIIGKAGFGYDINSLQMPESPLRQAYRLCFSNDFWARVHHLLQAFIPSSRHLPAKMNRDMNASRHIIVDKASEIIHTKQAEAEHNSAGKDIIALIARGNKKLEAAGEAGLSFETMRDQIMTFLGAGHDTTATAVAWTLHLLSTHLDVQSRLREEVRAHLPFLFDPDSRFDVANLATADPDQLPYLQNVCRESLRYIPPIPMTVRQSISRDVISGYAIPGGTSVYMFSNAINRLPQYWGTSADKFDPDRWDNLPETWTQNAFQSFLQGPRGCIGRKFAETEMKVMLCALLSIFEFKRDEKSADPEIWKMWRLVLRPRDGVHVDVSLL